MNLDGFVKALHQASATHTAETLLGEYLSHFGFRYYAFTYYAGHIKSGRKLLYHTVSHALRPWHIHYLEQCYADVDRTLEESYTTTLPLFWDIHQQLAIAKNKREERLRMESIEFGIDKGLSLPVYGPNNDFSTLTLHQCHGETCLAQYPSLQYEWLSAAHIFYHDIKKIIHGKQTINFHLTKREEECLLFTAKSWRVEKIAKELKISPRTVNFHLQNANKKCGKNNKYQSAYHYFQSLNHKE